MGCSRSISRNPVVLPMLHLGGCLDLRRTIDWRRVDSIDALDAEYSLELVREDLDELRLRVSPVLESPCGARAAGAVAVGLGQRADLCDICIGNKWREIDAGF